MQLDWMISRSDAVIVKLAGMRLQRDAFYGSSPFNATQGIFYSDAQYSFGVDSHSVLLGTAFNFEEFTDRTSVVSSARSYRYAVPAFFAQDEIILAGDWTVLLSGRLDFHNKLGTFFTPRASLMYRASSVLTMRIGGGTGFKSPTIFVEEAEAVGFRNVRPLQNIQAEKATSGSFDLNWRGIFGQVGASFNLAFYVTRLTNALLADQDSLENNVVYLRSAAGATLTRGGEFSAKFTYDDFKLSLGYTYLYASQSDNGTTYELELNPRHSFGAVLVWESQETATKVGIENYWTGSQRLERNPFRDRSPEYWITGIIAEKGFGHFRLFVNLENIFDTRQTRYEPIVVGNVQTGTIRTLPVYAPLEGRVINGGIRFIL
jgi:iron complex outermembrane receptor protein